MASRVAFPEISKWILFAIAFQVAVLPLVAQRTQPQEQPPSLVLKKSVSRVILDVMVTDPNGKPVHNLTQRDFSIEEDRKPQKILSFDVHDLQSVSEFPKLPPLPPNTFVNVPGTPERGPLYVLLLDLVNTGTDDQMYGRQQLMKFVDDKPEGTRFAVFVLSRGLHLVQGFTADKKLLFDAVDPNHPKSHIPRVFLYGNNYGAGDPMMMIQVFTYLAQYLNGLPGRKNVVWFSGGFPFIVFPSDNDPRDLRNDLKTVIDNMVKAEVSVFPVDATGLSVLVPPEPGPGAAPSPHPGFTNALFGSYLSQSDIAEATGGRAFYSRNDLSVALMDATELGGNFYTLTYASSNHNYDGKPRTISVKLSNKHYRAAYRRFYYGDDPDAPTPSPDTRKSKTAETPHPRTVGDSLFANMQLGAPMAHEIYFRAHMSAVGTPALATPEQMANLQDQPAYFRVRRKNHKEKPLPPVTLQTYTIEYTLLTEPKPSANRLHPPVLEVAAAAFDADGNMLNGVVQNTSPADYGAAQGTGSQAIFRVQQEIEVPLEAASIRVGIRDVSTDHIGAMEVPLPLSSESQAELIKP